MHNPEDHDHDHDSQQFEGFTVEEIKKNFKALGAELEEPVAATIETAAIEPEDIQEQPFFRGYIPTIKDYLARASTVEECEEIIAYCLDQGEINQEEATEFNRRLKLGGPRAFGTRKPGYYDQKL